MMDSLPLLDSYSLEPTSRYRAYGPRQLDVIARRFPVPKNVLETVQIVSRVLPFRVNEYVLTELIDWAQIPEDPIFRLLFPQSGMLPAEYERALRRAEEQGNGGKLQSLVAQFRNELNPHPAGQVEYNTAGVGGVKVSGVQHKYRETVLYFPRQGQTCHAYCSYCFRWAQFVGDQELRFAASDPGALIEYLEDKPSVSDVLVTGGDPMMMSSSVLRKHLEPLLAVPTIETIRIGSKALAFWPDRFVGDRDADDVLRLFEEIERSGRKVAFMAHFSHPRELETELVQQAISRIRGTGAGIYCQAPLMRYVNDTPAAWLQLWRSEISSGAVPYYMFVSRDTGPHEYFKVPLVRAAEIFREAYAGLPGLARTVRGPVMSCTPGKIVVDGVMNGPEGAVLSLRFLQARDSGLVDRPFGAFITDTASWIDDLKLLPDTPSDIAMAF